MTDSPEAIPGSSYDDFAGSGYIPPEGWTLTEEETEKLLKIEAQSQREQELRREAQQALDMNDPATFDRANSELKELLADDPQPGPNIHPGEN